MDNAVPVEMAAPNIELGQEPSSSTDVVKRKAASTSDHYERRQSRNETTRNDSSRRRVMGREARDLVALVYKHMKKEAQHGVENLGDARWRTAKAIKVSENTVSYILRDQRESDNANYRNTSPHRKRRPHSTLRDIDEYDKAVIKDAISTFKREFNKSPTLNDLKQVLKDKISFNGCTETLRGMLEKMGYEFRSVTNISPRNLVLVEMA